MTSMVIDTRSWATAGHGLGRALRRMVGTPDAILIASLTDAPGCYVQWHGEADDALYSEAASGAYSGYQLTSEQDLALRRMGWDAPGAGWGGDAVLNYSRLWVAPVDLYAAVRLGVVTLRSVYGAAAADCEFTVSLDG